MQRAARIYYRIVPNPHDARSNPMPKRLAVALVALLLTTAAPAEEVPAKLEPYPLPPKALGVLTKLADASDVLVLGELHGTQETPTIAAALLAPLSQRGYREKAIGNKGRPKTAGRR